MATYLDEILAAHRRRAREERRDLDQLLEEVGSCPPVRPFASALQAPGLAVISEIKRRSPSKGLLSPNLQPAELAQHYAAGGAACLSVLTDEEFFGGSPADLASARSAVSLPVLRKDFTVSSFDVVDARLMGADAILLIAAALSDAELVELGALAGRLGLGALFEVHDENELDRVLAADGEIRARGGVGVQVVGVNQRDLHSFAVDTERAVRVASAMPAGVVKVAESGIEGPPDAVRLAEAGFDAILVGESLVRAADPAAAVSALRSVRVPG